MKKVANFSRQGFKKNGRQQSTHFKSKKYLVSGFRSITLSGSLIGEEREDEEDNGSDDETLESHFGVVMDVSTSSRREKVLPNDEASQGESKCGRVFKGGLFSSALLLALLLRANGPILVTIYLFLVPIFGLVTKLPIKF